MKNSAHFRFSGFFHGWTPMSLAFVLVGLVGWHPAFAENAQEARVTRIVKDVKLVGGNAAARPAAISDQVRPGNGVRTGTDSRAELTFSDLSITRLGANTVFSFNGAGRTVDLGGGAILVEAPPNSAAIHVNTAAFSAAISGGTGLIEFHPSGISKVMVLEGKGDITPTGHTGETLTVPAGQMVTLGPDGKWSKSQKFNVALVMKSAQLITDFGSLPNEQLIFQVIDQQKNDFGGTPNNQPPHDNTLDATIDRNDAAPPGQSATPGPTPPVGNIPVITSPNPYIIGSGTTITTDPTITTNGHTDQGALYHGSVIDGPVSAFAFDSTSAFDTASGFDLVVQGDTTAAGFKFTALQLTGNPTVDTTNGPDALALIAVDGITSAGPGGNITFSGIRGVLLAAQNGSVTLGSELSFSGLHDLTIYARGASSDLTLGSNISTGEHANLFAERNMALSSTIQTDQIYAVAGGSMTINGTNTLQAPTITLNSFHDLTWDGETSDTNAGNSSGNVTITAGGNIHVTNDLSFTRHSSNSEGLNLTLSGGHDVMIGGIFSFVVDNSSGGNIDTGGNIAVTANGNLTVNGAAGIELDVLNNGGHIGTGGNISVSAGGNLTAEGLDALIISGDGGAIDHGVTINVSAGGALNLDFGSQLDISTSAQSTSNGGTIAGDALIQVTAGSLSTPNSNNLWFISNNDGGHIEGNATVSVNITGNAAFGQGSLFDIENHSVNTLAGGAIDGNAVIDFSAGNISSGDSALTFQILNQGNGDGAAGQIGGNATITIHAANLASASSDRGDIIGLINNRSGGTITNNAAINLTATGAVGSTFANNVDFTIDNDNFGGIGGDASVTAQMASLGAGNSLSFAVNNAQGVIGGSATVDVTVTGANGVNLPNQATFTVNNTGFVGSIQPHEVAIGITGDAGVSLSVTHGGLMDDDGLEVSVDNSSNSIGGNASVAANVANEIQINAGAANFEIFNTFGSIAGAASVSASAGSISANNVSAQIDNTNGTITGGANVTLNVGSDVTANSGTVMLQILNEGGSIGTGSAGDGVSYTAGGTTTASQLTLYVDNSQNGVIGQGGNVTLHTTGPVTLFGGLVLEIDSYAGGNVTTGANMTAHFGGDLTTTAGNFHSFNFFILNGGNFFVGPLAGGTIGTGGNMNLTFDGNATTTPTATTGSWTAELANDGGSIGTGGNISVTVGGNVTGRIFAVDVSNRAGGHIVNGGNVTVDVGGTVTTNADAEFQVFNNGGTIDSLPTVSVHGGSFNVGGNLIVAIDNESGSIGTVAGGVVPRDTGSGTTFQSDGAVTVTGGMYVLGQATVGGDINVGQMASTDVTTPGAIHVGAGGITQFRFIDGQNTIAFIQHTLTANAITSQGGINFNGDDATEGSPGGNGGVLTLNANSLSFDSEGNIAGPVTLNGGNGQAEQLPGNGGTLTVNTTGNITVNNDIEATSGYQDAAAAPNGNGGSVTLKATNGLVTVNSRIEVSSDDPTPSQTPPPPIRRSATGGTILLESNLTSGTGITVSSNGQLLSLLNLDALNAGGTPGSITLSTRGADILVNGYVRADFGTVTIDQNDPAGSTPTITLDGATVQAATFNINGSGDLTIGPNNSTAINIFGGTWNVAHDITLNAANTSFAYSFALNATAGDAINFTGGNSDSAATLAFPLSGDTTFTAGTGGINARFVDIQYAGAALNLMSGGDITLHSLSFTDFFARGTVNAAGAVTITNDLGEGVVTAGTSISAGGNVIVSELFAGTTVTAGGSLSASYIQAGGDITAASTHVQNIDASSGALHVSGTISPDVFSTDPMFPEQGAKAPHVYNVDLITAPGGIDFNGNQFGGIDGYSSGGILTVNARTLDFNGSGGIGAVNFDGADAGTFTAIGGDGGSFTSTTTTGDLNVSSSISATTGNNLSDPNNPTTAEYHGAGGNVTLSSQTGAVNVNSAIEVSSNQPVPFSTIAPQPYRKSASGGNITIQSGKATGDAIVVNSTAQLLSLLDNAAPGPGGVIMVKATGNSSTVRVSGNVEADRGTIDVEQTGPDGTIAFGNSLTMRADTIKVGALGANGNLLLGNSTLTADTLIALYGGSSNGTVEFNADMTLAGATTKIIAAHTVQIDNGVTVTILGAAADVYAHIVHYDAGHGGDGSGGSFAGSVNTHIDGTAPPFGQTSSIAQANTTTRSRTASRSHTASTTRTTTTVNQSVKTTPTSTIQRIGIVR